MTTELAKANANGTEALERAIVQGDLSGLSDAQRVQLYLRTCESLGINPYTKPFDYLKLNGRLILYPLRACTDQLRSVRGVSVTGVRTEMQGDLVIVTVSARDRTGREDTDIGAVPVNGLRGEALANATMKAITKGKRRVTLSLCGLGWVDETEVSAIPGAERVNLPDSLPPAVEAEYVAAFEAPAETAAEPPPDEHQQLWKDWKAIEATLDKYGVEHGEPAENATKAELRGGIKKYKPLADQAERDFAATFGELSPS
jgi:hypothetical protein